MTRTPEQIENHRKVLSNMLGPVVVRFFSDDDIDAYADRLQKQIDDIKYYWDIKVRLDNMSPKLPWDKIPKEPTSPYATADEIKHAARHLINSYPTIAEVRIADTETKTEVFVFSRPPTDKN